MLKNSSLQDARNYRPLPQLITTLTLLCLGSLGCVDDLSPSNTSVDSGSGLQAQAEKTKQSTRENQNIGFKTPHFEPAKSTHPLQEIQSVLHSTTLGYCVQFRSVKGLAAAEVLQERIQSEASLPVSLLKANLGKRGIWYRICAGNESTAEKAEIKAQGWTSAGGKLSPFMEPIAPGQAAFFIKKRPLATLLMPSKAQAQLLLAAHPDGGRPVKMLHTAQKGSFLAAVSALAQGAFGPSVLVVDAQGNAIDLQEVAPKNCKACAAALLESPLIRRVLVDAFNVGPWPGDELLVEEGTSAGASLLSIYAQNQLDEQPDLLRVASLWLGSQESRLQLLAQAKPVEADGDADREIAVITTELPLLNGRLCGLRRRAEIFDLSNPKAPRKLGAQYAVAMARAAKVTQSAEATRLLVHAYDQSRDYLMGSRICAAFLGIHPAPNLAQHCIGRFDLLSKAGRKIEAVNAAGALAEATPALRPAIAGPFFNAVQALNADARLTVHNENCFENPLLEDFDKRPIGQAIRMAKVRAKDRMNLAEVSDAVFATGIRDFGPQTPVGRIVQGWLKRLKVALPARYAAIEALLIVSSSLPPPKAETSTPKKGRPPIIIQVHDEPEFP